MFMEDFVPHTAPFTRRDYRKHEHEWEHAEGTSCLVTGCAQRGRPLREGRRGTLAVWEPEKQSVL